MVLHERRVSGSTITMTVFLKLLMLIPLYVCAPCLKNYAILLYFVPDAALIGLYWIPLMFGYARRLHMDYALVSGSIASLYTLTVLNAVTVPLFVYYPPAAVTVSSLIYATGALAIADLILASLLLPVRTYTLRHVH